MSVEGQKFDYPGEDAKPEEVLRLAGQYLLAANALLPLRQRGNPLSLAPFRQLAIHAIELHLNALLLARGYQSTTVRGMQHNLAARTDIAIALGLDLRKRTAQHLRSLSETREYLVSRYDPGLSVTSEINRLSATLNEVASKVSAVIRRQAG
ncbi:hypothetical protein LZ518_05930 [Sphingomonas sp. RB56-2]|uniref:HEPN domain-containing protein n=1 Tax=Sphingomonas brevis TaxID=2908206 RepID=A0ABT0S8F1_9SPHN|nr:hypothetical protein [Sphingomonas brevis]MCL6740670.1 hypothetical protein [Sphingomonas brevis]